MRMGNGENYQPVMIRTLVRADGRISKSKIIKDLHEANPGKPSGFFDNHDVFAILTENHPVAEHDEQNDEYKLKDVETYENTNSQWKSLLVRYCQAVMQNPNYYRSEQRFEVDRTRRRKWSEAEELKEFRDDFQYWLGTAEGKKQLAEAKGLKPLDIDLSKGEVSKLTSKAGVKKNIPITAVTKKLAAQLNKKYKTPKGEGMARDSKGKELYSEQINDLK